MDNDTESADASPTRRRSIVASLRALTVTLTLLLVAWLVLRYVLTPLALAPKEPVATQDIAKLEVRVATLEEKFANTPPSPPLPDISALEARLRILENAPAHETTSSNTASPEEINALKSEISSLKMDDKRTVRSLLLGIQLQDALRTGRPFSSEMGALIALRPDMKSRLEPLNTSSTTGIATLADLQEQFARAIFVALKPASQEKTIAGNLRSLVTIRKVGEAQNGADDESILARSEAKLAKADVVAALQELEKISTKNRDAFVAWKQRAEAHLAAQHIIDTLPADIAEEAP